MINLDDGVAVSFAGIIRESIIPLKGSSRTILLEILINCNYSDNPDFIFDNKKLPLKRGQWVSSQKTLSELTDLTRQQIRTGIKNLKNLTILSTNNLTNRATLYTIDNVDKFLSKWEGQPTNQPTNQPTPNQPLTINNKDNNNNKDITKKRDRGDFKKSPPPPKKNKGTRLSEDWELPDEWGEWAEAEFSWSVKKVIDVAEAFKDYWIAKSGKDATKVNWQATWRNWCRKQQEGF